MSEDIKVDDFIPFCQCGIIPQGGYCAKHGSVNDEDRLKRRASAEAYKRVASLAEKIGWSEIEKKLGTSAGGKK